MPPQKISELIRLLEEGTSDQRSNVMRSICPCRSHVLDKDIWKIVFQAAHQRGKRVRGGAVHAIATLLQRAKKSRRWRSLLRELSNELDQVLSDPEACKILRQGMQHDAEVAGGLTPAAHCRNLRRFVELTTPDELADWLNDLLGQRPPGGVHPSHPGLIRLWRWQMHRITFQPERDTDPREFLRKAERWLPEFFRDANIELDKLVFDCPRQRENSVTPEQVLSKIEDDEEALRFLESSNPKRRAKGLKTPGESESRRFVRLVRHVSGRRIQRCPACRPPCHDSLRRNRLQSPRAACRIGGRPNSRRRYRCSIPA